MSGSRRIREMVNSVSDISISYGPEEGRGAAWTCGGRNRTRGGHLVRSCCEQWQQRTNREARTREQVWGGPPPRAVISAPRQARRPPSRSPPWTLRGGEGCPHVHGVRILPGDVGPQKATVRGIVDLDRLVHRAGHGTLPAPGRLDAAVNAARHVEARERSEHGRGRPGSGQGEVKLEGTRTRRH